MNHAYESKTIKYGTWFRLILMMLFLIMTGCGIQTDSSSEAQEEGLRVYLLNKEKTTLVAVAYHGDEEQILDGMMKQLAELPNNIDLKAPLQMDFAVLEYRMEGNLAIINVDDNYYKMAPTDEVLVRAALVRTISQIPEVECVSIQVNGEPLMDRSGMPVGNMRSDTFVDNEGIEINNYEKAKIKLYFASEDGMHLKEVIREIEYNSNISMEKVVLEQLASGTEEEGAYPVLNPDIKINTVTVADGICYVDFNNAFLQKSYSVSSEVIIYSVVNTLTEITKVNKVQISVEGENEINFMENISLNTTFERNLDLMEP